MYADTQLYNVTDINFFDAIKHRALLKFYNGLIKEKEIVIYGAGAIGRTLKKVLNNHNRSVSFFVDKKYKEISTIDGTKVLPIEELSQANSSNCCVIVCISSEIVPQYEDEIFDVLSTLCPSATVLRNGRLLTYVLTLDDCNRRFNAGETFDLKTCIDCGAESRGCMIFENYLRKSRGVRQLSPGEKKRKFETFFGYITGKNCTLRCKHCNEMVPYYKERGFVSKDEIIADCRKLSLSFEFMPYMELVGGEPLLHPEIKDIITDLLEIPNIGYIKIFTNGTVVPNDELCDILKNPRIIINLSNYTSAVDGILLENIYQTIEQLKKHKIHYISSEAKTWLSFSFFNYKRSESELEKCFQACSARECHRVYKGTMYRCHHQYAGVQLGKFPEKPDEVIHIDDYTPEQLREACDRFEDLPYTSACQFCNWPFDAEEVPAAEQLDY